MNRTTLAAIGAAGLLTALTVTGCSSAASTQPHRGGSNQLSIGSRRVRSGATLLQQPRELRAGSSCRSRRTRSSTPPRPPTLAITYAAVEDNVDPATGKAIDDRLQLT